MERTRIFEHLGSSSERILNGVVSRYELNVLKWIATRLPDWSTPDQLTTVGVVGAAVTGLSLALSNLSSHFLWLALVGLIVNWFGDSLDGTLARTRGIERPRYGFFVDHLSDVASQICIVLGLGLSPYLRFDSVCLALIAYFVVTIYTLVKLQVFRNMQLTYFGIGPTEVRVVIGVAIVTAALTTTVRFATPLGVFTAYDIVTLSVAAFAIASAVTMFCIDARQLAVIDPPRSTHMTAATLKHLSAVDEKRSAVRLVSSEAGRGVLQ